MSFPKVAIIVLNWNGWEDTVECLESLTQIDHPNYQIIVVDNASTNDSIKKIEDWAEGKIIVNSKYFKFDPLTKPIPYVEYSRKSAEDGGDPERGKDACKLLANGMTHPLIIIKNENNLGFAKGNNVGIRYSISNPVNEYILILNNDTVVKKDFLNNLVEGFKIDPRVALAGPKIYDYYSGVHWQGYVPRRINFLTNIMLFTPLYRIFIKTPFIRNYLVRDNKPKIAYGIPGCAMMFKRELFKKIGYFDEATFLGWEEYIVAEKLMREKLLTYVMPRSVIYHKVARDTMKTEPSEKTIIFLKSEKYFQDRYLKMPSWQVLIVRSVRASIYSALALVNVSYRKNYAQIMHALFEKRMK